MAFPDRKTVFWTIFLSAPKPHTPSKALFFLFVVTLSLTMFLGGPTRPVQLEPGDRDRQLDNEKRPVGRTDGHVRGTEGSVTETGRLSSAQNVLIAPVPLTILIVGVRVVPLRKANFVGLGRLSGPTATAILSRYTLSHDVFLHWRGAA